MSKEFFYNGFIYKRVGNYILTNKTISSKILRDLGYDIIDDHLFIICNDLYIVNNFDDLCVLMNRKNKLKKI